MPPLGCEQADEHADRGRLARAVGAEEAEDLAGADVEGDAIDGGEVAERAREVLASMATSLTRHRPRAARRTTPMRAMKLSSTVGVDRLDRRRRAKPFAARKPRTSRGERLGRRVRALRPCSG